MRWLDPTNYFDIPAALNMPRVLLRTYARRIFLDIPPPRSSFENSMVALLGFVLGFHKIRVKIP